MLSDDDYNITEDDNSTWDYSSIVTSTSMVQTYNPADNDSYNHNNNSQYQPNITLYIICTLIIMTFIGTFIKSWQIYRFKYPLRRRNSSSSSTARAAAEARPRDLRMTLKSTKIRMDDEDADDNDIPAPVLVAEFPQYFQSLDESALQRQFELVNLKSLQSESCGQLQSKVGRQNSSRTKNKYVDIVPYDDSRVVIRFDQTKVIEEDDSADYINASYVCGAVSARDYIAAQAPTAATVDTFWTMIWQEKITLIIMLTGLEENGRIKCHQYWPVEVLDEQCYTFFPENCEGDTLKVKLIDRTEELDGAIIVNKLQCHSSRPEEKDETPREIIHIKYADWLDHDTPDLLIFAKFMQKYHEYKEKSATDSGPVLVHCSAGVGRSGTFICIDRVMTQEIERQTTGKIDIFSIIREMRQCRMLLVQTRSQYKFIFNFVAYLISNRTKKAVIEEDDKAEAAAEIKDQSNDMQNEEVTLEKQSDAEEMNGGQTDKNISTTIITLF